MIRTGDEYKRGLRDGREVYVDGARVNEVTTHPQFQRSLMCAREFMIWRMTMLRAMR